MSDPNDLKVEISTGDSLGELRALTNAVTGLTSAFKALDSLGLSSLRADFKTMDTSMSALVKSLDSLSGQMAPKVRKAMDDAAGAAVVGGKKLGKAMGDGVTAGLKEAGDAAALTARAQVQKIQAEYDKFSASGKGVVKLGTLRTISAQGVSLSAADLARLSTGASALQAVKKVEGDLVEELDKGRMAWLGKMQTGSLRIREGLTNAATADYSSRMGWVGKLQTGSLKIQEGLDKIAAQELARETLRQNRARDLNATFAAMSPAAQLTRATRVSAIAVDGPGAEYATKKYGSSAVDLAKDAAAQAVLTAEILRTAEATSALNAGKVGLKKSTAEARAEAHRLKESHKELRGEMNELHSAARGLAGGFGAMWLTWGSIVPLLAGAAISTSLVQAVKSGAEFENTLRTLGELSGASAEELKMLSEEALRMGSTSKYGPLEVAEALKTLALAGLDATEQMTALKPTLNFATVGEMDIGKAAESLTAISTAFGYSATGFSAVGDVVAKAAAISMSSVSDMTEAFRQASTIAQQFGVSIEDASLTLALLAQVGIRGSAAGTAMRNMYNELIGSSKQAREILTSTLGVDIIDKQTKKVKELSSVIGDLAGALAKFEFKDQLDLLQRLGNERGTKAISAVMTSMVTEVQKAGGDVTTVFKDMQQQMADAPGFVAMASIGMAMTAKNQIASVGNAMQSALIEAFQAAQPAVLLVASELRSAINSEEFKAGLKTLVEGLAEFVGFVVQNIDVFASIASGLALGAAALVTMKLAAVAATVVLPPLGVAIGALAAGSAVSLATLAAAFWPVTAAIAVVGAAWWLLSDDTKESTEKAQKASQASFAATMEGLDAEAKRLEEQMRQRAEGNTQETIAAATRMALARQDMMTMHQQERATLQLGKARIITALSGLDDSGADAYRKRTLTAELEALRNNVADAVVNQVKVEQAFDDNVRRVKNLAAKDAKEAKEEADRKRKVQQGERKLAAEEAAAEAAKARAKSPVALVFDKDKELEQIKSRYSSQLSVIKDAESSEKALLNSQNSNKLISQGEFHFRELALTIKAEKEQLDLINSTNDKYQEAYGERTQSALEAMLAWDKDPRNAGATEAQRAEKTKQFTQEVEKLTGAYETFMKGQEDAKSKVENGATTRLKLQANEAAGALLKAKTASDDFWKAEDANRAKAKTQDDLDELLRYASPEARAYLTATAAEQERLTAEVDKHDVALKAAEDALFDYVTGMQTAQVVTAALNQGEAAAVAVLEQQVALRKKLTDALPGKVDDAGQRALAKAAKESEAELVKSLAGAVETALFEGGKAGSKKLRDIVVAELRKPISVFIQASVRTLVEGGLSALGFGGTSAAGGAAGGSLISTASNLSTIYNGVSSMVTLGGQVVAGTMSVANALGTIAANTTGTGISGLLATNGAYGTAAAGSASSLGASALAAAPYVAGALVVANALGLFKKTKRVDGGISATLGDNSSYQTYDVMRKGGSLFSGPKYSENFSGNNAAISKTLNEQVAVLKSQISNMASQVGVVAGDLSKYATSIKFSTQGLSGEQIQQRIAGAFETLSEDIAKSVVGTFEAVTEVGSKLKFGYNASGGQRGAGGFTMSRVATTTERQVWKAGEFVREGETAIDALTRLSSSLSAANAALAKLGDVTFAVSLAGADAASKLADAFGGLEVMAQRQSAYYLSYYSEQERLATTTVEVAKGLALVGVAMPTTKAAFRALVTGLDLTTDAGRNAYAVMLALAPEFAAVADAATTAWQGLTDSIFDEVKRIRSLMAGVGSDSLANAQARFAITTAQARAGDQEAAKALPSLSQALLELAETGVATLADLQRLRGQTAGSLAATGQALGTTYGLKLPSFDVGTNYVPRNMIAQLHEGEAVVPKAFNPAANTSAPGQSSEAVVAELKALRQDNADMRAELRAIASHGAKTAKILERVTRGGEALATTPA